MTILEPLFSGAAVVTRQRNMRNYPDDTRILRAIARGRPTDSVGFGTAVRAARPETRAVEREDATPTLTSKAHTS